MEKIINYKSVEAAVKGYQRFVKEFNLDLDEEKYIIDIALANRQKKINDMQSSDMMSNMISKVPLGGLFKRAVKEADDPKNFEDN